MSYVSCPRGSRHNSRAGHPGCLRCSALKCSRHSRASRLASQALRFGTYATIHGDGTLNHILPAQTSDRLGIQAKVVGQHRSTQRLVAPPLSDDDRELRDFLRTFSKARPLRLKPPLNFPLPLPHPRIHQE